MPRSHSLVPVLTLTLLSPFLTADALHGEEATSRAASRAEARAAARAKLAGSNVGGILVLDADPSLDPTLAGKLCDRASLADASRARVELPGDGEPRVVVVYTAFPSDSVAAVAALSFGIRYSDNVRVHANGACNGAGLVFPFGQWPGSGSGVGLNFDPVPKVALTPVFWFTLACEGEGYFEVVPHPIRSLAGHFANEEIPARIEPISSYAKIGFGAAGRPATFSTPERISACCLGADTCVPLSPTECDYYGGFSLGEGVECDATLPCSPEGQLGACCLAAGCEPMSRRECVEAGGVFKGHVSCASVTCP